jgi:hypothetical protein
VDSCWKRHGSRDKSGERWPRWRPVLSAATLEGLSKASCRSEQVQHGKAQPTCGYVCAFPFFICPHVRGCLINPQARRFFSAETTKTKAYTASFFHLGVNTPSTLFTTSSIILKSYAGNGIYLTGQHVVPLGICLVTSTLHAVISRVALRS